MAKDVNEFIKEALKAEIELFKVFSIFLVALVSAVATMILGDYYSKGWLYQFLFYAGIIALAFVLIIFTIFVMKILRRLNQLKNSKS
jgi:uncharacterized membrane protein